MVYVYEQASGTLVTLTGSDEPFETSEDDSDDIFTPIRHQTGYLRVVDETANGNLMETMMPINNTEKMVCLYTGTWDADFTTFTRRQPEMAGVFCVPEAFTQPWDKQTKVVEFPVKSVLAAMEDVFLPESSAGNTMRTGKLIEQGLAQLGASFATVAVVSNLYNPMASLIPFVKNAVFYSEENINNQGDSYQQIIGSSLLRGTGERAVALRYPVERGWRQAVAVRVRQVRQRPALYDIDVECLHAIHQ